MKSIKIVLLAIIAVSLSSCHFDLNIGQVNGNGNVVTENRPVTEDFTGVRGSSGIDVILEQGTENKIVVVADENLQELIETEIHNGFLKIKTSKNKNIGRSKSKKVYVTYINLETIEASSGADVVANNVIKSEYLTLKSSSGADLELEVNAKELTATTSSGSDIKVYGKARRFIAEASSGSDLNARELLVKKCKANASSGADITVNVMEDLEAKASSGGDIKYYGNPLTVNAKDGRSGGIRKM